MLLFSPPHTQKALCRSASIIHVAKQIDLSPSPSAYSRRNSFSPRIQVSLLSKSVEPNSQNGRLKVFIAWCFPLSSASIQANPEGASYIGFGTVPASVMERRASGPLLFSPFSPLSRVHKSLESTVLLLLSLSPHSAPHRSVCVEERRKRR